jgi:hypothetical protein
MPASLTKPLLRRLAGTASATIAAAVLAVGCGGSGSGVVAYSLQTGYTAQGQATTSTIIDLGLPELYHQTSRPVRMLWVRPAGWPAVVHLISVTAYNYFEVGSGIIADYGDLPRECPKLYRPHPLTDVVTAPHEASDWFVVLAFTIPRPGRYHLNRVKIGYEAGGQRYWQYQNTDTEWAVTRSSVPDTDNHACEQP